MRLVVQRVKKASVEVKESGEVKVVGSVGNGLFVLVGIKKGDSKESAEFLAAKLAKLRVMSDKNDKMNFSVSDVSGKFLVVSQFTLHADVSGGNRPSFINAEDPVRAKEIYECFVSELRKVGADVETGNFGDYMKIDAVLDGPVTIILES